MSIDKVKIGDISVSRMIIGGNPFSGFSHHGVDRDMEMKRFYTVWPDKRNFAPGRAVGRQRAHQPGRPPRNAGTCWNTGTKAEK